MSKIIEVENVSKKYVIKHQNTPYNTLVETLTNQAKKSWAKLKQPFSNIPVPQNQKSEDFWSLKDINFSINEGDKIGIVGRNGAGKSTLLKVLSRITEPTTGRIKICGRVSSLLEVGTGFHNELTGRENIFLNGSILGMSRSEIRKKFDQIVAFAGVEKFLDTPVKRYSSGMHMRLGFAIAAHLEPDVLIIDEVLAVGDASFQEKCLKKLDDLNSDGRTVIFVSHDIGAVLSLCNKGIFLENGRIKNFGAIDECVAEYMRTCHTYSTRWQGDIGDDQVRFYEASLVNENGTKNFSYNGDIVNLEIEYEVKYSSLDMIIGLSIYNQRKQVIASSHNYDDVLQFPLFNTPGKHKVSFAIDTSLFHEGEYLVRVDCVIHNKRRLFYDDILLKMPIYMREKNTTFTHVAEREGSFLGNCWTIHK